MARGGEAVVERGGRQRRGPLAFSVFGLLLTGKRIISRRRSLCCCCLVVVLWPAFPAILHSQMCIRICRCGGSSQCIRENQASVAKTPLNWDWKQFTNFLYVSPAAMASKIILIFVLSPSQLYPPKTFYFLKIHLDSTFSRLKIVGSTINSELLFGAYSDYSNFVLYNCIIFLNYSL